MAKRKKPSSQAREREYRKRERERKKREKAALKRERRQYRQAVEEAPPPKARDDVTTEQPSDGQDG
jgi:hypothetical protein